MSRHMSTGEDDSKKEQTMKMKKNKKRDEDRDSEGMSEGAWWGRGKGRSQECFVSSDGSDGGRVTKTVLERWRESLLSCSSLSQV